MCVCNLKYPACNAHAPYYTLLSSVACLALTYIYIYIYIYIYTLRHKRHDFRKNVSEYKMCVRIFSTNFSETFIFLYREILSQMCVGPYVKYPTFLSDLNVT